MTYDFETKSAYSVTVTATDDGDTPNPGSISVTINLTDVPTFYRQKRTWTGRNSDNTADVTLTSYGSWSTSSTPPSDAPDIVSSEPEVSKPNADGLVRLSITWTDNNGNKAYQRTGWYAPTRTEYREVKNWSDGLGKTTGPWGSTPNPQNAPNVGNRNGTEYRDNGGAGGTWVWEGRALVQWFNPQLPIEITIYGPWVDRGGSHPDTDPPAPGAPGSTPSHEPSHTTQVESRKVPALPNQEYRPTSGPSENLAGIENEEFVPTGYRQVRTWTGRNKDNTSDVTLTTYGTWSNSTNPPQDAPNIAKSEPSIETRDTDEMVRKKITWTDNNDNHAYQFTQWYAPTRTEYREVKHWSDGLGKTVGQWGSSSPPLGAPNVGNRNGTEYRDNGGAGGTWVWEGRALVYWFNPQLNIEITIYGQWVDRGGSHPDTDPPAPGAPGSTPSHEPSHTTQVESRKIDLPSDYAYVPANGPTENSSVGTGVRRPEESP